LLLLGIVVWGLGFGFGGPGSLCNESNLMQQGAVQIRKHFMGLTHRDSAC
jgi:hypothetical protein